MAEIHLTAHLSKRLWLLMTYAKSKQKGEMPVWKAVAEVLKDEYCEDMPFRDVIHHVIAAYEEALAEPKFELRGGGSAVEELLLAPIKGFFSVEIFGPSSLEAAYSVDAFYNSMIKHALSELRMARVDWCRDWLFTNRQPEKPLAAG